MKTEEAKKLLYEWVQSESLRGHCETVAASMRYLAEKYNQDIELWAVVGLLHDLDYEKYPNLEEHPYKGVEYLRSIGVEESICRAILSHADYSGVSRDSQMEKALFAVDELSGFVGAVALVRPSKSFDDLEVSSVKKKMKDKAFAAKVSRDDIKKGAEELGVPLEELIADVIEAQKSRQVV